MAQIKSDKWWKWEIVSEPGWFKLGLRDLYYNRDLITRFVKRDLLASHQQTILGPLWLLLQPILSTLIYVIIFNRIVKISTDDIQPILFYLSGVIIWTFFSDTLLGCMYTFRSNENIFNKVYFPRIIVPISIVLTQTIRLLIQIVLLFSIYIYFLFNGLAPDIGLSFLLMPFLLILTAGFAFGLGLIMSIFTIKYRDLDTIISFILRVFMFLTPVFYPASLIPEKYKFWTWINPLVIIIRSFRQSFKENKEFFPEELTIITVLVTLLLILGILLFKRMEVKVMDVI